MSDDYIPGMDCICSAHNESECGCGVDWTPRRVYQLERELTEAREQRDRLKEELQDARLFWAKYEDRYFEAREQRDKLAEALEMVRDADDDCHKDGLPTIPPVARHEIDQALGVVAVKDPHKFCRGGGGNNFHCGCKYDS